MISDSMRDSLNSQIDKEFYSSYFYLSIAAYFEEMSLLGMAKWMRVQAQEENAHGLIFFNYVLDRGGKVKLGALPEPPSSFKSPLDAFQKTLEHEEAVTASINKLMDQAIKERDHATRSLLDWFVDEQVEEEASVGAIVARLKLVGKDSNGLFSLDSELGTRVFTVPAPLQGKI